MSSYLWEILVPAYHPKGGEIPVEYHREWDAKVREMVGGLTILRPVKGQWVNPNQDVFREKMIPVRIACNIDQIYNIVEMTQKHYNQDVIMVYAISDRVYSFKRGETSMERWENQNEDRH